MKPNSIQQVILALLITSLTGLCHAQTIFNNSVGDNDFLNAANWSGGVPGGGGIADGIIDDDFTAELGAYTTGGSLGFQFQINGTLNVNGFVNNQSGSLGLSTFLGNFNGSHGVMNINSGGTYQLLGASADIIVGAPVEIRTGTGEINVFDGGSLRGSKSLAIRKGSVHFADGAISAGNAQDELIVSSPGTLSYEIDAVGGVHYTMDGQTLEVQLGETSTLEISFSSTPTVGQTFDLVTGVSSYGGTVDNVFGYSSGYASGTGVFGTVNATGLGAGQALQVNYLADTLQVEVISDGSTILGDCDLSGTVDFSDISPFIAALSGGSFLAEADCDQSGTVDFSDISAFIAILSGS